jgi:hypothetical protein
MSLSSELMNSLCWECKATSELQKGQSRTIQSEIPLDGRGFNQRR